MAELLDITDGYQLEDVTVLLDDVEVWTAQSVKYGIKQEKKPLYGSGTRKAYGRTRGPKVYEFSMECKTVNMALLSAPADWDPGQGDIKDFTVNGETYKSLMDLRNCTLVLLGTALDGTRRKVTLKKVEFSEDSRSLTLGDAEGATLTGDALDAEGIV